jgi:hypothetical protein
MMIDTSLSPQVRRLADRLIGTSIGALASYGALSDAVGQDVLRRRHWITTALRVAQREAGAVFVCEKNVGYRRLTVEEIPGVGFTSRKHIRSTARRASRAIVAGLTGSNSVPESVKLRASTELAVLGLVEHLSSNRQVVKHEAEPSPERVGEVARTTMLRLQEALQKT